MKKNLHIATLIFILGIFLMPTLNYACGTNAEKRCCKNEMPSKTEKKSCCESKKSENQNKPCGGKCGHSNCTVTVINYSLIPLNDIDFRNNAFVLSNKKQNFFYDDTFLSSGFTSVWLPPKIR